MRRGRQPPELLVELTLLARERGWHYHLDSDVEVALAAGAKAGKPATRDSEHGPRLGSRRHDYLQRLIEGRNLDLGAERRVCHPHLSPVDQVGASAHQGGVRGDIDDDQQVSRHAIQDRAGQASAPYP
jgi:hypothetical protein